VLALGFECRLFSVGPESRTSFLLACCLRPAILRMCSVCVQCVCAYMMCVCVRVSVSVMSLYVCGYYTCSYACTFMHQNITWSIQRGSEHKRTGTYQKTTPCRSVSCVFECVRGVFLCVYVDDCMLCWCGRLREGMFFFATGHVTIYTPQRNLYHFGSEFCLLHHGVDK